MPANLDRQSTPPLPGRAAVWSRHWSSGALHSCGGSFGEVYGGSIGRFWTNLIDGLPQGARVLDIASGNGALPMLMLQRDAARLLTCDAIDLADVQPSWLSGFDALTRQRLRFHGRTAAEHLPFADGSFDLAASQYGIEYASRQLALAELARVVRPGGSAALVMHHADSRPVQIARFELDHLEWLLGPDGLVDASARMLEPLAMAATPEGRARLSGDRGADAARATFNEAQRALTARTQSLSAADILIDSRDALLNCARMAMTDGVAAGRARLAAVKAQLIDQRFRLVELCSHALDAAMLGRWQADLADRFEQTEVSTLVDGEHVMAWALQARLRRV